MSHFQNTPKLRKWLEKDHPDLAKLEHFEVEEATFQKFLAQFQKQGDHKDPKELKLVALFAALTHKETLTTKVGDPIHVKEPPKFIGPIGEVKVISPFPETKGPNSETLALRSIGWQLGSLRKWVQFIAVILLVLLGVKLARGQNIASGDITTSNASCVATACVSTTLYGVSGTVAVQITGTFTGTLQFEGTLDGTNYAAVNGMPVGGLTATTSTVTTGMWQASASGLQKFQVRASALSMGTATVNLRASPASIGKGGGSSSITLTGDVTGSGASPITTTVVKVDGVAYPASPSTNTVPVVTGANTVTYEAVPNAALANSAITLNAGTNTGYTAPGAMTLGSTYTFGATTDAVQQARLGLGAAASATDLLTLSQGTRTTDAQGISSTVTWNAGGVTFTGWKLNVTNTASNAASKLMDLQVGSASKFYVQEDGTVTVQGDINATNGVVTGFNTASASTGNLRVGSGSSINLATATGVNVANGVGFGFHATSAVSAADVAFRRSAASVAEVDTGVAGTFAGLIANPFLGGTAANATLVLQSTNGAGVGSDSILMKVGNNGATTVVSINTGGMGVMGSPVTGYTFNVTSGTSGFAGRVYMSGLTTAGAATATDLCLSSNEVVADSALCVVSAARFKRDIQDSPLGLDLVERLRPVQYFLKEQPERGQQFGFIAEEVESLDKRFVTYQDDGQIRSVLYLNLIPILAKAIQQLNAKVASLEAK